MLFDVSALGWYEKKAWTSFESKDPKHVVTSCFASLPAPEVLADLHIFLWSDFWDGQSSIKSIQILGLTVLNLWLFEISYQPICSTHLYVCSYFERLISYIWFGWLHPHVGKNCVTVGSIQLLLGWINLVGTRTSQSEHKSWRRTCSKHKNVSEDWIYKYISRL